VHAQQFVLGVTRLLAVGGVDFKQMPPHIHTPKTVERGVQNALQGMQALAQRGLALGEFVQQVVDAANQVANLILAGNGQALRGLV
jgi:hypothetical protein